ncbi:MAG: VgrG-related protein [Solirubrobacteraceae bacterium]
MSTLTLIAGFEIRLNASKLEDRFAQLIDDVVVQSHLRLPDSFAFRLANPGDLIDDDALALGDDIEILFAAPGDEATSSVVQGEIVALEPHFDARGTSLTVRGYDYSHKLNRTRLTSTYQSMTYGEIARKVLSRSGLTAGTVDDAGGARPFVQQTNETDWDFLWRLAREIDFELVMTGNKANFRAAGGPADQQPITAVLGDDLLVFRPRVTGVQQIDEVVVRGWDPTTKQTIEATAATPTPASSIGMDRSQSVGAFSGGTVAVVDRPVASQAQAQALADSVAAQLANAFVEGDGTSIGDPRLLAGSRIEIEGVGARFGGTYAVTAATHRFRRRDGYRTSFEVSGRSARTLLGTESLRPARTWARSVVVGVVTNNQDPDALGRIRVQCLELDSEHEGWWARLTAPAAGADRGLLMLPQAGDEVLLAFEHDDDEHPFVIGSLWNGTAKPGELAHEDGSFHLASDKQVTIDAAEAITANAGQDLTLEAGGKLAAHSTGAATLASDADVELNAQTAMKIAAGTTLDVEGMTVTLAGSGQVEVRSDGSMAIKGTSIQIQANASVQISAPSIMLG